MEMLAHALEGYNVCIFAYGQTGVCSLAHIDFKDFQIIIRYYWVYYLIRIYSSSSCCIS